jgi:hypothetical protein
MLQMLQRDFSIFFCVLSCPRNDFYACMSMLKSSYQADTLICTQKESSKALDNPHQPE